MNRNGTQRLKILVWAVLVLGWPPLEMEAFGEPARQADAVSMEPPAGTNRPTEKDSKRNDQAHSTPTPSAADHGRSRRDEYILFSNFNTNRDAVLIDFDKNLVHTWTNNYGNGSSVYLLEDGSIVRAQNVKNPDFLVGGTGGRIERLNWDGEIEWAFDYSTPTHVQHHDIELLPNGNILFVAWNAILRPELLENGREPILIQAGGIDRVWADTIIELKPTGSYGGEIVWQWNVMDHLVQEIYPDKLNYGAVSNHPERINFNYPDSNNKDWLHINSIDYNAELDQILVSSRYYNEIWIIDHSTTTEEAASHSGGKYGKGGDLLYRWGNPAAYGRGTKDDQILGGQHNATWIPEGYPGAANILVFNNGIHRKHSSVDEITPPLQPDGTYALEPGQPYGPTNLAWTYDPEPPFYAWHISGAQRLPDGNTLICEGYARKFSEVTPAGEKVWSYDVPGKGAIFRATRVNLELPE